MREDQFGDHRHDFLEDLAALLHEQLVGLADAFRRGAVQEAEIVADVVGEFRLELRRDDFPAAGLRGVRALDDEGGGHVAEDEMAVAVAEIEMAGTDLRIAHQDRARMAGRDHVGGGLQRECRRRTGHVHVEAEAIDAERVLHFDRHGGIGALHVRGADEHAVDVAGLAVGALHRIARGGNRHLGQNRNLIVGPLRQCAGT